MQFRLLRRSPAALNRLVKRVFITKSVHHRLILLHRPVPSFGAGYRSRVTIARAATPTNILIKTIGHQEPAEYAQSASYGLVDV